MTIQVPRTPFSAENSTVTNIFHKCAMTSTSTFNVLISGSGIAGPALAFWLSKANNFNHSFRITIVERASAENKSGQGIDIAGPAAEVVTRMGLLETIKSKTTGETGLDFVDNNGRSFATFGVGGLTREIEIMRGDLCKIFTDSIKDKPNVRFLYEHSVTQIKQTEGSVQVTIKPNNGQSFEESFDAVVAADGVRSKSRDLILDPADTKDCLISKDLYTAYFDVPAEPQDWPRARVQQHVLGRGVLIRPRSKNTSSGYLYAIGHRRALSEALKTRDLDAQKEAWVDAFSDLHTSQVSRALEELRRTDNFYSDEISQIKLPRWSNGRCALLGDAAYCPSPLTGKGTALAILGAYVLAGELSSNPKDPAAAFREYENKLKVYVGKAQQIPLGGKAPKILNPQSAWAIWLLQTVVALISWTKVWKILPDFGGKDEFPLPDYQFT